MQNLNPSKEPQFLAALLLSALLMALVSGCSAKPNQSDMGEMDMVPLAIMPVDVQQAPVNVQQAYRFAAANPNMLSQIPCYCGCGPIGHISNYSCYISAQNSDGSLAFDTHALGCSICVDITQDSMRLLEQGKSVLEIRSYIDNSYAQYGPSNMP